MVEIMKLKIIGLAPITLLTNKINDNHRVTCSFIGDNTTVDATRLLNDSGDYFLFKIMYDNGDYVTGHGRILSRSINTHDSLVTLTIKGDNRVIHSPTTLPVGTTIICPDGEGKIVHIEGADVAVSCGGRLSVWDISAIKSAHDKLVDDLIWCVDAVGDCEKLTRAQVENIVSMGYRKITPADLMLLDDVLISEVEYKYEALKELIARLK